MRKIQLVVAGVLVGVAASSAAISESHTPAAADNTARNQVDADMDTVLPEDQSNDQAFLDRTAAIRKAVVDNDRLSTMAKNIKIITIQSGAVILRGPVKTTDEKNVVEGIARRVGGSAPVRSFLTVTGN